MQLVTNDTINFLPIPDLQTVVLRAIVAQANADNPTDAERAARVVRDRQTIVLGAMNDSADYPEDQRSMLMGYWELFGGNRK